ncbi:RDD family protein [Cellulomonas fimi]|uniref:RDD family protein n=1 Tax=Cellulomonas fimi TaxID=1708 RepID=A0A7Y0LZZ5_CELFI|nr:RDD family protein [Cellulomonas fimi]NMR21323.1 RDD family protein [Cellulomonas fimi]
MAAREDLGSWLEGGPPRGSGGEPGPLAGLPAAGTGSRAPLARRLVALAIDWALSSVIATQLLGPEPLLPVMVFALENLLLVGTLGYTIGHRLVGIQVRPVAAATRGASTDPAPDVPRLVGLGRAALRTALLCLVIPAVVWDRDGRGLHDRAAGTVIVRR